MSKPKIRFKGFIEDWEQRKVSELAKETYGGGTPKTSIEEYWNGTIPWIQSSDITEHDVNGISPKKFISEGAVNKSATKLVPENSIAIVTRVGVGKLVIMPFSYATSQDFLSLSKLNSDVSFTAYLLYKKMQNESHAVQGTSIKGITKEELLSKNVMIPQLEEQCKIGKCFHNIDNLITLHQRKCEEMKKLKKYMLQKMFPQNGKNIPEIRFEGFTEDWEQRKVSELAKETYGGGTPKTSIEEYWNGTIPWIQSSDITEHDVNGISPKKFISEGAVNKSATKLVPENSIAIVTRVGVGKLVIMPFSYATSQDFLSLSKLNSDVSFTAYLLYKKMQNESHAVQGTSIKGITKEELLSKNVMIPQLEEQCKIGKCFHNIDNLITLHQRKLESLQNIKKFMLEKMFV